MEEGDGDTLHCEEQLRSTLHCDDKDKLRRKLALLQKEYLRTAQKLQRAERLDAVRKHVRGRITPQKPPEQRDPEVTSNPRPDQPTPSLTLDTRHETAAGEPQHHENPGGPADSDNSSRIQVSGFLFPEDTACATSPGSVHDTATSHRPGAALRLRSRRSRLRWERRSAEAGRSTENSEDGQEPSERMETRTEGDELTATSAGAIVVDESEELFSASESESPSLLLSHWSTQGHTQTEEKKGNGMQEGDGEKEREAESKDEGNKESKQASGSSALLSEGDKQDSTQNGVKRETEGEEEGKRSRGEKTEETSVKGADDKGAGLMDSCTLVEGLLFPAEYYVRTTRRMASSHSQPDVQAVILSQLSAGRRRRGRGRGSHRHTHHNGQHTDVSPPTSASPHIQSQAAESSGEASQSFRETTDQISASRTNVDAVSSPAVRAAGPGRGRGRRGRSRGRPLTPHRSVSLDICPDDPQPTSSLISPDLSSYEADRPKPLLNPDVAVAVTAPDDVLPSSSHSAASSEVPAAQSGPASGQQEVYPIFLKSSSRTHTSSKRKTNAESWRSLLLSSPPAQTSPLPLPSLSLALLVKNVANLDMHQDFHLPDDQFASLKLHKLRQVTVQSGVEHFSSPSYNTRSSGRRSDALQGSDPVTPLPLPLSLTPTVDKSPRSDEEKRSQPVHVPVKPQTSVDLADKESDKTKMKRPASEEPTDCCSVVNRLEDPRSTNHQMEDKALIKALSFSDCPLQEGFPQACSDTEAPAESPVKLLKPRDKDLKETSSEPTTNVMTDGLTGNPNELKRLGHSQLPLTPPLASAPCPFITPHPASPALLSSPTLPSLGLTPQHPVAAALPLPSSPPAPPLTLPPPHSPSTLALSPPALSPCASLPPLPPASPSAQIRSSPEVPAPHVQFASDIQDMRSGEAADERGSRTHTLKAPAGGCLVDACCLLGSSGRLCVAAAGKWAVCLWRQTSASDWSLTHTWTFSEPVINVFPVPDAAGLMCVTLGQLEIREVRTLSSSSLSQALLCAGVVQTVVGVSRSRVVSSSHSESGSTLQVFTLSDNNSTHSSQPLTSPGVCVGAVAPVDGLSDALIGTDEAGCLFVWNLKTGQLLRRIALGDGLSHTACLRGYSSCGVLLVLLQHQFLSSLEEDKEAKAKDEMLLKEEERRKSALFSLVAVNPLSGNSALAAQLHPPTAWSGRLCEADVNSSSVVGLSQSGCVCVWELWRCRNPRMLRSPHVEGWQLARWGGGDTLMTGDHHGDVTLHVYRTSQTSQTG